MAATPDKIQIGLIPTDDGRFIRGGPLYTGLDQGFYEKYGLEARVTQYSSAHLLPAIRAGVLQFGAAVAREFVKADLAGASFVMIAICSNYPPYALYGAKGVSSIQELNGKAVAVTTPGSSTEATGKIFRQASGVDYVLQFAGTDLDVLDALAQGEVAGGIVAFPRTWMAEQAGFKQLANGPGMGVPVAHSGIVTNREYLESSPEIVTRFLHAYLDSWRFVLDRANKGAVISTLAKWTRSEEDISKHAYDHLYRNWAQDPIPTVDPRGIEALLSLLEDPKARTAQAAPFIDNSLLQSLAE